MSSDRSPESLAPLAGQSHGSSGGHHKTGTFGLAVGSVGVVYGDIGTSPLYALRESLSRVSSSGNQFETSVISVVSLLLWALIFVVTIKYVLFILRCDNRGEGGTLSLMALAQNAIGKRSGVIFMIGIFGAALFSGDAIITPAISVLSAVEGLQVVAPSLQPYVVLITVVILVTLFSVQKRGTAGVARWFGPIMCFWFLLLASLGLYHIFDAPRILQALNPMWGLHFLFTHKVVSFLVLGAIFLAVTGTEAIYADMGHFGRKPIQIAWISFVLPALALNYLGQGAMLLSDPASLQNPFFLMAPESMRLPLVIMATLATVIASQAIITGAFSVARQAIQLGLLPRLEIQHTSETQEGQIYLPTINRLLLLGVLLLVVVFRSSSNLASAYGIAISASMIVDSILAFIVVWKLWRWPLAGAAALCGLFLVVEVAFFLSNSTKFLVGGYIPAVVGITIIAIMWTWMRGTKLLEQKTHRDSIAIRELIRMLQKSEPTRVPGTAIFLTSDPQSAPAALMHNLKHNKVLHERVLIVCVRTEGLPRVSAANRYEIEVLSDDFTAITLHFGFMENPRVPAALVELRKAGIKFDIMTTSFFLGRRTLKTSASSEMPGWQDKLYVSLSKQAANATDFFSIPSDRVVELGAQVTI
ncbi:MAG: potassium transporter Kup [Beijerinckiaceae bacterium]